MVIYDEQDLNHDVFYIIGLYDILESITCLSYILVLE